MSGKTILLVEDEALIAMSEAITLQRYGYQPITVYSGEEALKTVAATPQIDLILMDIDLGRGRMDGTRTAELILQQRDVPLIFLSSHTERSVVERTEGITSYGYIVKNSGETVLVASIKMAFRLFEARMKERASQETFRNIVRLAPLGIHLYQLEDDDRLVFIGANVAADRMLGIDNTQFVGQTIEQAFPALVEIGIPQHYRRVAREGVSWQTEQVDYAEGDIRGAFEVHAFQISPGKITVMFNEITARKQAEELLRRLLQEKQVLLDELQQLSGDSLARAFDEHSDPCGE